jgi:hypothetical protein
MGHIDETFKALYSATPSRPQRPRPEARDEPSEQAGHKALVADLRQARAACRGDVLRATLTFECPEVKCPVHRIQLTVVEEFGRTRPMQPANRCCRCHTALQYICLSVSR